MNIGLSGLPSGTLPKLADADVCAEYSGVQYLDEIVAKGFSADGLGGCRLIRNHEAFALSGIDTTLMGGWTGAGISIAVIDSGFRISHETIRPQVEKVAAYLDSDGDFFLDKGEKRVDDPAWLIAAHGTAVASLAAGHGVGPAPGARLWLKATGDEKPRIRDLAIATLDAVKSEGLSIINLSNDLMWNGLINRRAVDDETGVLRALKRSKAVIVAPAGNAGRDLSAGLDDAQARAPASRSFLESADEAAHVLLVGVYDTATEDRASSSNYPGHRKSVQGRFLVTGGKKLETASSGADSAYREVSGTSFTAPLVSGALAVLRQANPRLTAVQAADILLHTARRPANLGYGRVCTAQSPRGIFSSDCGAMKFGMGIMDLPSALKRARSTEK